MVAIAFEVGSFVIYGGEQSHCIPCFEVAAKLGEMSLPESVYRLYHRIRLHCETLVTYRYPNESNVTPGQVLIAQGVISLLDHYAQIPDQGAAVTACISTLRIQMPSWLAAR